MKVAACALIIVAYFPLGACQRIDALQVQGIMWKCVVGISELERFSRLGASKSSNGVTISRVGEIGDSCEYAQVVLEHRKWRACEDAAGKYTALARGLQGATASGKSAPIVSFSDADADLRSCTRDLDAE